jgi:undecaprenyl-diphosphatase
MHHPTDLVGSLILAAGWLAATIYLVRPNCDLRPEVCPPERGGPDRAPRSAPSGDLGHFVSP